MDFYREEYKPPKKKQLFLKVSQDGKRAIKPRKKKLKEKDLFEKSKKKILINTIGYEFTTE